MNADFGNILTRQATLVDDRELSKLARKWEMDPLAAITEAKTSLVQYRTEFSSFFNGAVPLTFHSHVSDVSPQVIGSTVRSLIKTSPVRLSTGFNGFLSEKQVYTCGVAVLAGSYGAGCGPLASTSCVPYHRQVASGPEPEILRLKDIVSVTSAYYADHVPSFVIFGKGLRTSGLATCVNGVTVSHLGYNQLNLGPMLELIDARYSEVINSHVLLQSWSIIRRAASENWPQRAERIGSNLRQVLKDVQQRLGHKKHVRGCAAFIFLNRNEAAELCTEAASAGKSTMRWLPFLDAGLEDYQSVSSLFGASAASLRENLINILSEEPTACVNCGESLKGPEDKQWKRCKTCKRTMSRTNATLQFELLIEGVIGRRRALRSNLASLMVGIGKRSVAEAQMDEFIDTAVVYLSSTLCPLGRRGGCADDKVLWDLLSVTEQCNGLLSKYGEAIRCAVCWGY
ncbi:hypothetical protein CFRS1_v015415 [Colletotrichum fructicola]|nr:hypothetical protein CFRS1_v015855 [Colletotrichum fructicola]KAF4418661.1 hypothetical protein CFRS1_v015415 [Colletotrichum fructicola]